MLCSWWCQESRFFFFFPSSFPFFLPSKDQLESLQCFRQFTRKKLDSSLKFCCFILFPLLTPMPRSILLVNIFLHPHFCFRFADYNLTTKQLLSSVEHCSRLWNHENCGHLLSTFCWYMQVIERECICSTRLWYPLRRGKEKGWPILYSEHYFVLKGLQLQYDYYVLRSILRLHPRIQASYLPIHRPINIKWQRITRL